MIRSWVPLHLVVSWHARLIERFGGPPGTRDIALLEGALARPQNLAASDPEVGIHEIAGLYGVALTKAHGFIDGSKRIGFAVMVAFLKAHGWSLDVSESAATDIMTQVADGTTDEAGLASWLVRHCRQDSEMPAPTTSH